MVENDEKEEEKEEEENEREREIGLKRRGTQSKSKREKECEREREDARMGAALFKRGWGCQIELPPRTTTPRGRLPGRWRSCAASGCRGLHRYLCSYTCARHVHVYAYARARATSSAEAFSIKINTGGWPRPRTPLAPLPVDTDRFDLSS